MNYIAAGDFLNNGTLDLAAPNITSSVASMVPGNGDGTFQAPKTTSGPPEFYTIQGIVAGDFGNGNVDLAVTNPDYNYISVLIGNGDGTFQPPVGYGVGGYPQYITEADLTNNGIEDLIVANAASNTVSVLMGNGDGTFQPGKQYNCNSSPTTIAVGDFFGDGKLDIAVTNETNYGQVSILRGNGDGTFQAPIAMNAGYNPDGIAAVDLRGNGLEDLVVSNRGGDVLVYLNKGNGTFADPQTYAADGTLLDLAVGDFNGDGLPDVAVTDGGDKTVQVFLNRGGGNLASPLTFQAGQGATGMVVGDFTGNGRQDLAVANYSDNTVTVFLNDGSWAPNPLDSLAISTPTPSVAGKSVSFTVKAINSQGVVDTEYNGTVSFASSDALAGLPSAYTFSSADNGGHTFTAVLKTAGTQTLTALDYLDNISVTDSGTAISPAAASGFQVTGFPVNTSAGQLNYFRVQEVDAYGNVIKGYRGTVTFASSDPRALLPANYTFTSSDQGSHTFAAGLLTAGTQSLLVKDERYPTLIGSESGIVVNPGNARTLRVTGFPASLVAGQTGMLTVTAVDAFGNLVPDYEGTVYLSSSDPKAFLSSQYTFAVADQGSHVFAAALETAGKELITATDLMDTSITGNESGIVVHANAMKTLQLSGFPTTVAAGSTNTILVQAVDAYGNPITNYLGTVQLTTSDANAILVGSYTFKTSDHGSHHFVVILKTAGQESLTVQDAHNATWTSTEANITVQPRSPATLVAIGLPTSVTPGQVVEFNLEIVDLYGNVITTFTDPLHFQSSDRQATLPDDYVYTSLDAGQQAFGIIFETKGKQTVTISDPQNKKLILTFSIQVGLLDAELGLPKPQLGLPKLAIGKLF